MTTLRPKAKCPFCETPRSCPRRWEGIRPHARAGEGEREKVAPKVLLAVASDGLWRPDQVSDHLLPPV